LDRAGNSNAECRLRNAEWKKEIKIPNSTFRIPNLHRLMGPPHPAEEQGDLRSEFFSRRCFLRVTPLLPGHKLAFPEEKESQK